MTSEGPFLDTNILLRYFMQDDPGKHEAVRVLAEQPFGPASVPRVAASTISEYVFVARGAVYQRTRGEIASSLDALATGPFEIVDRDVILRANEIYRSVHDDWDDCLLAAYAIERAEGQLVSFDRGLDRIPGLRRIEPIAPGEDA